MESTAIDVSAPWKLANTTGQKVFFPSSEPVDQHAVPCSWEDGWVRFQGALAGGAWRCSAHSVYCRTLNPPDLNKICFFKTKKNVQTFEFLKNPKHVTILYLHHSKNNQLNFLKTIHFIELAKPELENHLISPAEKSGDFSIGRNGVRGAVCERVAAALSHVIVQERMSVGLYLDGSGKSLEGLKQTNNMIGLWSWKRWLLLLCEEPGAGGRWVGNQMQVDQVRDNRVWKRVFLERQDHVFPFLLGTQLNYISQASLQLGGK